MGLFDDATLAQLMRDMGRGAALANTTDVVGMPVDVARMMVPQGVQHLLPNQIPGGSEWLRQKLIEQGMIDAPEQASGGEMLGGLLGGLVPTGKLAAAGKGLLALGGIGAIKDVGKGAKDMVGIADSRFRKSIDDLTQYMRNVGLPVPKFSDTASPRSKVDMLDEFLGTHPAISDISEPQKAKLRNLWGDVENSSSAFSRVYGKDEYRGKDDLVDWLTK